MSLQSFQNLKVDLPGKAAILPRQLPNGIDQLPLKTPSPFKEFVRISDFGDGEIYPINDFPLEPTEAMECRGIPDWLLNAMNKVYSGRIISASYSRTDNGNTLVVRMGFSQSQTNYKGKPRMSVHHLFKKNKIAVPPSLRTTEELLKRNPDRSYNISFIANSLNRLIHYTDASLGDIVNAKVAEQHVKLMLDLSQYKFMQLGFPKEEWDIIGGLAEHIDDLDSNECTLFLEGYGCFYSDIIDWVEA